MRTILEVFRIIIDQRLKPVIGLGWRELVYRGGVEVNQK